MKKKYSPEDSGRKSEATPLKEVMKDLLESYHIDGKFHETQLISSWESMMGKAIAKRTSKIYIKDKKMFVELTSAPLKQELKMSKSKVMEMINNRFKKNFIEEIVFL